MTTVTAWVENGELALRFPYDPVAIEDFKRSFCAEWRWYDRKTKVWHLTLAKTREAEVFCRKHFGKIVYLGEMPSMEIRDVGLQGFVTFLDNLPRKTLERIYRAILFELHPDRGGDHEVFVAFKEAWERWREQ